MRSAEGILSSRESHTSTGFSIIQSYQDKRKYPWHVHDSYQTKGVRLHRMFVLNISFCTAKWIEHKFIEVLR